MSSGILEVIWGMSADMSDKVTFELNGQTVEAEPGETIWQVANRQGVEIPHLCYAPEPGYRPDGNCRVCMVEIEGERKPACVVESVSRFLR